MYGLIGYLNAPSYPSSVFALFSAFLCFFFFIVFPLSVSIFSVCLRHFLYFRFSSAFLSIFSSYFDTIYLIRSSSTFYSHVSLYFFLYVQLLHIAEINVLCYFCLPTGECLSRCMLSNTFFKFRLHQCKTLCQALLALNASILLLKNRARWLKLFIILAQRTRTHTHIGIMLSIFLFIKCYRSFQMVWHLQSNLAIWARWIILNNWWQFFQPSPLFPCYQNSRYQVYNSFYQYSPFIFTHSSVLFVAVAVTMQNLFRLIHQHKMFAAYWQAKKWIAKNKEESEMDYECLRFNYIETISIPAQAQVQVYRVAAAAIVKCLFIFVDCWLVRKNIKMNLNCLESFIHSFFTPPFSPTPALSLLSLFYSFSFHRHCFFRFSNI